MGRRLSIHAVVLPPNIFYACIFIRFSLSISDMKRSTRKTSKICLFLTLFWQAYKNDDFGRQGQLNDLFLNSVKMKPQRCERSKNRGSWVCPAQLDYSKMATTCISRVYMLDYQNYHCCSPLHTALQSCVCCVIDCNIKCQNVFIERTSSDNSTYIV